MRLTVLACIIPVALILTTDAVRAQSLAAPTASAPAASQPLQPLFPTEACSSCCSPEPEPGRMAPPMFGDIIAILIGFAPQGTEEVRGIPISPGYAGLKIAENESPLPQDRAYVGYNYYNNVSSLADVHREVLGLEKTFFDGRASVGLRLPFIQVDGRRNSAEKIDDISVIFKYALLYDRETGSVLTPGLVITPPTGAAFRPVATGEEKHIVHIQPFVGYLLNRDDVYVHGFSSLVVPTDDAALTVLFNDIGIGYRLYQNNACRGLTAVIPTFEAHVITPLSHRSVGDPERHRDAVDLTAGSHFVFNQRTSLGVAIATPVTGPRLFDFEALVNLNVRW